MKKRILMVYPEIPTTYWSLKHALKFIKKKSATIPLGLMTVAALLPEDYEVSLVDMNVDRLKKNDIENADLVFISAMIVQRRSLEEVISLCNKLGTPVVAGGPYPTSSYETIKGVDHFVLNEAEMTLHHFISDYEAGMAQKLYTTEEKPDITKTPPPRFDLIDINSYNNVALQNSRGCPFNCEFCDIIEMFGRKPRFKDTDQFINEMEIAYDTGFRGSLFIVDDNFIGNKRKVKELLRKIVAWQKEHSYPFTLFTEASIDMSSDDELLELMTAAGFDMVFVGIETPDAASLKACQKNQNLRTDVFAGIKKIQEAGMEVTGGFIVGFDEDTEDIFDRQIDFIQKAGIPLAMVGLLSALPKTQLHRRLEKEGRLIQNDYIKGNNTHDLQMNFVPRMPENKLIAGYKKIISEIYSPKKYFTRCLTFIKSMPTGPNEYSQPLKLVEIRAFFLSLLKQAFSRYGHHYIRFLFKVVRHDFRHFPTAINLSIKGYHFFLITEDILKADEFSNLLARTKMLFQDKLAYIIEKSGSFITPEAAKIERQFIHLKKKLERKYRQLNSDVQAYLSEQFNDIEAFLDAGINRLRQAY